MIEQTIVDFVRFFHLGGLALGLGLAIYLETMLTYYVSVPFKSTTITTIERIHKFVVVAVIVLWVSGVALLALRTNFDFSAVTPKLMAKLLVVTALSFNAVAIGRVVMPILRRNVGRNAIEFPVADRVRMAVVAAISGCSWALALVLGVFAVMKQLDATTLATIVGGVYALGLIAAVATAIVAPLWRRDAQSDVGRPQRQLATRPRSRPRRQPDIQTTPFPA